MRILLVTEFFPTGKDLRFSGGVEARTFFIAKYLAKKHKVLVISSRLTDQPDQESVYNFKVYRVGPKRSYQPTVGDIINRAIFTKAAISFTQNLDVDIVDGGNFLSHFIAKQISARQKIPCVFWYPDVWLGSWIKNSGFFGGFLGSLLERFNLLRSADQFLAISKSTAKKLDLRGVPSNKIQLIPCGVDLTEFKSKINKDKSKTIICISRLVSYKRVEDLIWAFALLNKKMANLKLKIIGSGPEKDKLLKICQMLKITRKVQFMENLPRKDLVKNLKEASIFCLPSGVEGFGISIIEAAAAGIPYVVSNIPVFREVTKYGQGGLFFDLGNIDDLTHKNQRLLRDQDLYQRKVREGIKLAEQYQWSTIAAQTERAYLDLLNKRNLTA